MIKIIYAQSNKKYTQIELKFIENESIHESIKRSGILNQCNQIDLNVNKIGIYGKLVSLDKITDNTNRIEIYRSLKIDPKNARRIRAEYKRKNSDIYKFGA